MNYSIIKTHIKNIRVGDTINHNDKIVTVCETDIKRCDFMGLTIKGDSYNLGYKIVNKLQIKGAK